MVRNALVANFLMAVVIIQELAYYCPGMSFVSLNSRLRVQFKVRLIAPDKHLPKMFTHDLVKSERLTSLKLGSAGIAELAVFHPVGNPSRAKLQGACQNSRRPRKLRISGAYGIAQVRGHLSGPARRTR